MKTKISCQCLSLLVFYSFLKIFYIETEVKWEAQMGTRCLPVVVQTQWWVMDQCCMQQSASGDGLRWCAVWSMWHVWRDWPDGSSSLKHFGMGQKLAAAITTLIKTNIAHHEMGRQNVCRPLWLIACRPRNVAILWIMTAAPLHAVNYKMTMATR